MARTRKRFANRRRRLRNVRRRGRRLRGRRRKMRRNTFMSPSPFPNRLATRSRYMSTIQIDPTTGTPGGYSYIFVANGMFDPDLTGGGHQPMAFDQMMAVYRHYTVIGAKITCTFRQVGDLATDYRFICALSVRSDTTPAPTDFSKAVENGRIRWKYLSIQAPTQTVTYKFSAKKFFGARHIVMKDLYRGDASSNPTERAFFFITVFADAQVGGSNTPSIYIDTKIEYIAVFTEPNILAQS